MRTLLPRKHRHTPRGNILVGCLSVLGVVLIIAIIATIFVIRSYRGWIAGGIEKAVTASMVKVQINEQEQGEIMGHVQTLMTRYKDKDISNEQLAEVFGELVESPLVAAALLGGVDKLYLEPSDLSDEEKETGRLQLHRYVQGLFDESIDPDTIEAVLASVSTTTPDNDDIVIQYQQGAGGSTRYALRSADEVSSEDLLLMFAEAQSKADEAGIDESPSPIDLSDTLGVTIAKALNEPPSDWVEGYIEPAQSDADTDTELDDDSPSDDGDQGEDDPQGP